MGMAPPINRSKFEFGGPNRLCVFYDCDKITAVLASVAHQSRLQSLAN
jgi:hypothetical protein